jgi:hypothetical protein
VARCRDGRRRHSQLPAGEQRERPGVEYRWLPSSIRTSRSTTSCGPSTQVTSTVRLQIGRWTGYSEMYCMDACWFTPPE